MTKTEKAGLRADLFRHLDGIATAPSAIALYNKGILQSLMEQPYALSQLASRHKANEGYLNVALRTLCTQGWLRQEITENDILYSMLPDGARALKFIPRYKHVVDFIPQAVRMQEGILHGFDPGTFASLNHLFNQHLRQWDVQTDELDSEEQRVFNQIYKHIEGLLVGPITVALGINGLFHKYFSLAPFAPEEFTEHHHQLKAIINFFASLDWFSERVDTFNFTEKGLFYAKRSSAYGVTVSYLPTFMQLNEIIFGDPTIFWNRPPRSPEIHVNRFINVWGSGGAHATYFKKVDAIIMEIFNRPLNQQPRGILDMGCGNGAFLEHIFEVIWNNTLRGQHMDDFPLFIVGADYNEAALAETRKTLNQADIWAKVVFGDISRPDLLAEDIKARYDIELVDLLNVRSFLDHNRMYEPPQSIEDSFEKSSTGAFAFRGKRLPNEAVQQNLVNHLRRWAPYVWKFGLLNVELHTISPSESAQHLGKLSVTAYDATHGFSDQYILEYPCYIEAAQKAGLQIVARHEHVFPNADLVAVSINLFTRESSF